MKLKYLILLIAIAPFIVSCAKIRAALSSHKKLTKGTNYEEQYHKGLKYHSKGDYGKALALFKNVQNVYAGKDQIDTIMFYIADCTFQRGDYFTSADLFDQYRNNMGRSHFATDADFRYALSLFKTSPDTELDQTYSRKAINAFQDFIYRNPTHKDVPEAEENIKLLHERVYKSEVNIARTYYNIGGYHSSIVALNSILKRIPDIPYREDILFFLVESYYQYARSSVPTKQRERFYDTIDAYYNFVYEFPESKHTQRAKKYHADASGITSGSATVHEVTGRILFKDADAIEALDKARERLAKAELHHASKKKIARLQMEVDIAEKVLERLNELNERRLLETKD